MKTIIAGSRTITSIGEVINAIHRCGFSDQITEVVSGRAKGVDENGAWVAENVKGILPDGVKVKNMPADWNKFGIRAGAIRNHEMAAYADALILIWDGKSNGSRIMYFAAKQRNLRIYVHNV